MGQALPIIVKLLDGCDAGIANNTYVDDEPDFDDGGMGRVMMVISANDYKSTKNPLTCTRDAASMQELCQACGITQVRTLLDNENTKQNVAGAIASMAQQCGPMDTFIFYYSGHGTGVDDIDGDEADGQDEAYCFVDSDGGISYNTIMRDDEFAQLILDNTSEDTNVLIISDCCHSGTICDFGTSDWMNRRAVSMSGCADSQTSKDVGGGVFTHCLLYAIQDLQQQGDTGYSVAHLYNKVLDEKDSRFGHIQDQNIALQWAPGFRPKKMQTPLEPRGPYSHSQ
mmetsp:Transcript_10764/g.24578  ORF Transcript_10764/g.24578 Transcript_10764/m.24578 type:complete len:283 (-) Transcript_10764:161-1009(-)